MGLQGQSGGGVILRFRRMEGIQSGEAPLVFCEEYNQGGSWLESGTPQEKQGLATAVIRFAWTDLKTHGESNTGRGVIGGFAGTGQAFNWLDMPCPTLHIYQIIGLFAFEHNK